MSLPLAGGRLRLPSMGIGLWVAHVVDKTVMKLSLDGSLVGEVELDFIPTALALVEDDLWVLTGEGMGEHKGAIVVLSPTLETNLVQPSQSSSSRPSSILTMGKSAARRSYSSIISSELKICPAFLRS